MTTAAKVPPVTRILAEAVAGLRYEDLSADAVTAAKHCLLDWLAVTLPGASEPLAGILAADAAEDGGHRQATLIGPGGARVSVLQAALINGAAGHGLDYDDVSEAMGGHPTAPVLPTVLALAEAGEHGGRELLTAFVAGYECECAVGRLIGPEHYGAGFHATATVGSIGAAAAASRLLGLSAEATATAIGLAATQAAGLKSMFGTMTKPLHAGKAAANGVLAARLARRGFTANRAALECEQGFVSTLGGRLDVEAALAEPAGGFHIRHNLFKYHAACYLTHSPIEAVRALREQLRLHPDAVQRITLTVAPGHLKVCNIEEPATGLECKFSLRQTAAFALAGIDTAALASYSDENANRADLIDLRRRVTVDATNRETHYGATAHIELRNGGNVEATRDVGVPADDLARQGMRLTEKYLSLAVPVLGPERAAMLLESIEDIENAETLSLLIGRASYAVRSSSAA